MNRYLSRALNDSDTPLHRSALAGNAMLFNTNRWVLLTAGSDPLPSVGSATPLTFISALIPQINGIDGNQGRCAIAMPTVNSGGGPRCVFNFLVQGDLFWHIIIGTNHINQTSTELFYSSSGTVNLLNKKHILLSTYNGVINNVTSVRFFTNSFRRPTSLIWQTLSGHFGPLSNQIRIGRGNTDTNLGRFVGYMRSVELIIGRVLTDAELRRAFNFGTAHAAGLITPQDISIDFNQINGQAPICRTGSRQLTVTPYNNTTPDTAGTTYADFYSL
jgi:hypothetical protein